MFAFPPRALMRGSRISPTAICKHAKVLLQTHSDGPSSNSGLVLARAQARGNVCQYFAFIDTLHQSLLNLITLHHTNYRWPFTLSSIANATARADARVNPDTS